ncbi:MAG: hypothetical protein ABW168_28305 [Sedimenticola sp.]
MDTVQFKVFVPEEKIENILSLAVRLNTQKQVKVKELASFIGLLINAFHAILEAPLHYRTLEHNKLEGLADTDDYNRPVVLSTQSVAEVIWWTDNVRAKNGKWVRPSPINIWVQTDASTLGWGAFCIDKDEHTGGRWSDIESDCHINYLELLKLQYSLL